MLVLFTSIPPDPADTLRLLLAMASTKKKPRFTKNPRQDTSESIEDSRAACPFTIRLVYLGEQRKEQKRKRSTEGGEDSRNFLQQFPFSPEGKFKRSKTRDQCYQVDPPEWSEMQCYNSFVCKSFSRLSPAGTVC